MIDDFVIPKSLLALIESVLADFSSEWAPHYGIELVMKATVRDIENLELVRASMPKELAKFDADEFEENSFQTKAKQPDKLEQKKLKEAKFEEIRLRDNTNGGIWEELFDGMPLRDVRPSFANSTSDQVCSYFENGQRKNGRQQAHAELCVMVSDLSGLPLQEMR